jgi:hypothetical protein
MLWYCSVSIGRDLYEILNTLFLQQFKAGHSEEAIFNPLNVEDE